MAASVEELAFDLAFESPAIYLASTSGEAPLSIEGSQLYADAASADASLDEVDLALAAEIRAVRQENRPLVDRTLWFLRVGFTGLVLEVILFLAALAVH